jgi:opacity protein-like surface antigen
MNRKIRLGTFKYLFALATLLPWTNTAKGKNNYSLPYRTIDCKPSFCDWSLRVGFIYALPVAEHNKELGKSEMTGFNGGGFVEFGGAYWARINTSNFELHFEPYARLDVLSTNTCAYSVREANPAKTQPVESYPYENVQDFTASANLNVGVGYNGFTLESYWGLGGRSDTKGHARLILSVGGGVACRLNNHMKIRLGYRANSSIVSNTKTTNKFDHCVEAGFVYVFNNQNRTR